MPTHVKSAVGRLLPASGTRSGSARAARKTRVRRLLIHTTPCLALALVAWLPTTAAAQHTDPYSAPGGDLVPPPPPPTPESVSTVHQLERADREDSGRGLQFFWIDPEVGVTWVDLGLFSDSDLLDGDDLEASGLGPSLGVGLGGRFLYLTGGARFRYVLLPQFDLWTLGLEAALRIPRGQLEPYVFIGGGYLRTAGVDAEDDRFADLVLSGAYATVGGGVDYFLTPVFALGARADAQLTIVGRDALGAESSGLYASDGSGIGLAGTAALHLSLHF